MIVYSISFGLAMGAAPSALGWEMGDRESLNILFLNALYMVELAGMTHNLSSYNNAIFGPAFIITLSVAGAIAIDACGARISICSRREFYNWNV